MKTNYHTHTTRCLHAVGTDEAYIKSALKGGYQVLGFSDHTPWKYRTDYVADMRMLPGELPGYVESLRALREKYHDRIDIKIGLECEYFPDYMHWLKEQIKQYQLDYIIFGNHFYHTDEKFPYFGHHTDSRDMLDLYEESAIEGMETGIYCCLAHPDLFMRSYPRWDHHCSLISRHICRTAARLNIPLEYNIGYMAYNEAHGLQTYPCPEFWHIAANEGCTAIIGLDAHNNADLEDPTYYNRAIQELKDLKIKVTDTLRMNQWYSTEYNIRNHLRPYMFVQIAHQQVTPHHQFLPQDCRSEMYVKRLVTYKKPVGISRNGRAYHFGPGIDQPTLVERRLQTLLPQISTDELTDGLCIVTLHSPPPSSPAVSVTRPDSTRKMR